MCHAHTPAQNCDFGCGVFFAFLTGLIFLATNARMKKRLFAVALLSLSLHLPSFALDRGYWVVVGNLPQENIEPADQAAIEAKAAKCGFKTFNDFSMKFGFQSGYVSFVLGAYATRGKAKAVLTAVRRCVPDAYIKQGSYLGE
jgi:hypothetical protein